MTVPSQVSRTVKIWAAMLLLLPAIPAAGQNITVLFKSGDPRPDMSGVITDIDGGGLNDAGQFVIFLSEGFDAYRTDGVATVPIVRSLQSLPTEPGVVGSYAGPLLNEAGQAAFYADITESGNDIEAYYRTDGSTVVELVRTGQAVPGGSDTFRSLRNVPPSFDFNNAGAITFSALVGPDPFWDRGLYRADGATIVQLARSGQAAPVGVSTFTDLSRAASLNDAGQAAFFARIEGSGIDSTNNAGIFLADGVIISRLISTGQPAAVGSGNLASLGVPTFNNAGQAIFKVSLSGAGVDSSNDRAIYRTDGSTTVQLARTGDAVPAGPGLFRDFMYDLTANEAGQVVFYSNLIGSGVDATNDTGLYRADGTTIVQIAREGQAAPSGPGNFASLGAPAFNNAGQTTFYATLGGSGVNATNNIGLYFHDEQLGLLTVARTGDALLGSTITLLTPARDDLNNLGQLVFDFHLADGRQGVAIYAIPEPAAAALATALLAALAVNRRKVIGFISGING